MSRNHSMQASTCNASAIASSVASNRFARSFTRGSRSRAFVLYYTTVAMVLLCGFCSFAVDFGRVEVVKAELRRAADSAARAAAAELPDTGSATALARQYSNSNTADGSSIAFDSSQDIEFGKWDPKAATFTKLTGFAVSSANCVHITLRRTAARGNAVPLLFAKVLGKSACDVHADSYAMLIPAINVDQFVPATADPFLAGMPTGSIASAINPHNNPDHAGTTGNPLQSPLAANMQINGGDSLTFDSITGDARHDPSLAYSSPDGDLDDIGHNNLTTSDAGSKSSTMYNENGLADMWAPINALVGVFLDDNSPNTSPAPANLDFRSDASRDFTTLQPKLKQIFFIGDGVNSAGNAQQFIAPTGATRLYVATWDYYEWNNNAGSRNIKVNRPARIITVK